MLQAFVKQLLLHFAIQMSLPGFMMVESIFFREGWKCGLGYLRSFLGFHKCVQKLECLERNFFVLMKGSFQMSKLKVLFLSKKSPPSCSELAGQATI